MYMQSTLNKFSYLCVHIPVACMCMNIICTHVACSKRLNVTPPPLLRVFLFARCAGLPSALGVCGMKAPAGIAV